MTAEPTEARSISLGAREDGAPCITLRTDDNRLLAYTPTPTEMLALARYLIGWVQSGMQFGDIDLEHDL